MCVCVLNEFTKDLNEVLYSRLSELLSLCSSGYSEMPDAVCRQMSRDCYTSMTVGICFNDCHHLWRQILRSEGKRFDDIISSTDLLLFITQTNYFFEIAVS